MVQLSVTTPPGGPGFRPAPTRPKVTLHTTRPSSSKDARALVAVMRVTPALSARAQATALALSQARFADHDVVMHLYRYINIWAGVSVALEGAVGRTMSGFARVGWALPCWWTPPQALDQSPSPSRTSVGALEIQRWPRRTASAPSQRASMIGTSPQGGPLTSRGFCGDRCPGFSFRRSTRMCDSRRRRRRAQR